MFYILGIDTGGTYTDAVLLEYHNSDVFFVRKKAKAFTTKDDLAVGIKESIERLYLTEEEREEITKAVFSTTLATNAIVEGFRTNVGLISIGEMPRGEIATEYVKTIKGKVNIKGRILVNVNNGEIKKAVTELLPHVQAFAITGVASVKNPLLEQQTAAAVHQICDLPVICGHELVEDLGYLERTNTAILNAGLLPIINNFAQAIEYVLKEMRIKAPTFFVRGDGNITEMNVIKEKPIDTVLSGPAASMIGAINLTKCDDLVIADMGGTTTDTGLALGKRIELSKTGADVGNWKIKIKSAKLCTFGLGGDSNITIKNGNIQVGPQRVLPACRGGGNVVTPTDLLHFNGEFDEWDPKLSEKAIKQMAKSANRNVDAFVDDCINAVVDSAYRNNTIIHQNPELPVCAIGAPVSAWYKKVKDKYGIHLIVPDNYSVANAVGCAMAGVEETITISIRPGEEGYGYILHTKVKRQVYVEKAEAINGGIKIAKDYLTNEINKQNLEIGQFTVLCEDISESKNGLKCTQLKCTIDGLESDKFEFVGDRFIETKITVRATGNMFT